MLTRRAIAGLLVVIGAVAAAPAQAADRIFWTAPADNAVRAMDAGGGPVETLFTGQRGGGLDVDITRNRLVWSDYAHKEIRFGPLDGSGPVETLTATEDTPIGVAVDQAGGRLLWFDYFHLHAVPLGGGATTKVLTCCDEGGYGPESGGSLAVDDVNGIVYFDGGVGGRYLGSARLDGSGPGEFSAGGASDDGVGGVAVDSIGGYVYWTHSNSGGGFSPMVWDIRRAPLDGSGTEEVFYTGEHASGIAVDGAEGYLYWAGEDGIRRAPVDGSGPIETVVTTTSPSRITLLRTPLNTGAPELSGGSSAGSQLSCGEGTWAPDVHGSYVHRPPASFAYRWQRDGADIPGADGATYTASQAGEYRCVVTATNAAGDSEATSAPHTVTALPQPPIPGPAQRLALGQAFLGRSGAIFVPVTSANPTDATLRIRFRKPTHGFRTITRRFRLLRAGTSRARVTLSRKQRRKLLRIRRQRVTVTLTTPAGDRVSRSSTLSGRTVFRR